MWREFVTGARPGKMLEQVLIGGGNIHEISQPIAKLSGVMNQNRCSSTTINQSKVALA